MHVPVAPGLSIVLHDLGGDGEPLLLAHATGFHGIVWRPFAAELADRCHSWALDFRGHGDSSLPAGAEISWEGFADDVLAAVDAIAPPGPMLGVGHSKGGAALLTAEIRRPGTFRALWLFEPIVFPPVARDAGTNPLSEGARRRRADFSSRQAAIDNYASKPPLHALRADVLEAYVEHGFSDVPGGVTLKCRPEVEAATYRAGPALRTWDRLGEVGCAVTLAASGDGGFPATNAPELAARIPGARLVGYPDLGHFGPLEDPARLAADVRRALLDA
jgi:pimeloyl-ACP methyl ester carboxylesterase